MDFDQLVQEATGHGAYDYQRRVAEEGLPELLRVPTGAGKTLAVVLGWLYRRRVSPDSTPRRLVYVLPMRVLVEQVHDVVAGWLAKVAPEVEVQVLLGGEGLRDMNSQWVLHPERETVVVGTLDMILSRALNRGYGESRFIWPVAFGLLNSGSAWVFDEVQLMGPALPTSRQLEAFRRSLGAAAPCSSTWMSATVEESQLQTVDLTSVRTTFELSSADRDGSLRKCLEAPKVVRRLELEYRHRARSLADELLRLHRAGTRTIAIMNTVSSAVELWRELEGRSGAPEAPEAVLLHSRFRPLERSDHTDRALSEVDSEGPGCIVVSTQVLEAGVDLTSTTLFTEVAPWPSVVQRAGRCNRYGEAVGASLLWSEPGKALPYEAEDIAAAASALLELEGTPVTPEQLGAMKVDVARMNHPVLRRRDLLGLFDTSPDMSGNDLDIGRFLRDGADLDVPVAWWDIAGSGGPEAGRRMPGRDERCPVPIGQVKALLKGPRAVVAWRYDHLDEGWVRCFSDDVRPGAVIVLRASDGGYDPRFGWEPSSTVAVADLSGPEAQTLDLVRSDTGTDSDPATFVGGWVKLSRHLEEVEAYVRWLAAACDMPGIESAVAEAAAVAGRLHDVGKAHATFQAMLMQGADEAKRAGLEDGQPWAKSDHLGGRYGKERKHFRHELVSALALLGTGRCLLDELVEPDLVVYLVAAHHGRVRLGIRSLPEDGRPPEAERLAALGVWDGDILPEVRVPGGVIPDQQLRLAVMGVGLDESGHRSWGELALELRDRPDLGPFRIGFLEALVRVADWHASSGKVAGSA